GLEGGREQSPTKALLLARNLFRRLYNEVDESVSYFVEKYIDLFNTSQTAVCEGPRARCCQLIGLILAELEYKENEFEPLDDLSDSDTDRLKSAFIRILISRTHDKSACVRAEVIRALSVLNGVDLDYVSGQFRNAFNLDKWVKKELRDVSREVRMEAVRAVALGSSVCVDDLLDVLSSETAANVRRLIFARITRSIDVTDLSLTQRMRILRIGLNDEDGVARMIVGDRLLPTWAGGDNAPPLALLKHLEFVEGNDICFQAMEAYFSHYRKVCGYVSVEQLVNAIWQKSNEDVEAVNDGGMITAKNCVDMLEGRPLFALARDVFLWRCIVEYCDKNAQSEADRGEARRRLLPEIAPFCRLAYKFLWRWSSPTDTVDGINEEFIFIQLCFIARTYDLTDSFTMDAWKGILEMFVSVRCLPNSARAIELALNDIFSIGYAKENKIEEYVEWCCYRMNSFMTRNLNDTEVQPLALALVSARDANTTQPIRACRATDRIIGDSYEDMEEGYKPERRYMERALLVLCSTLRQPQINSLNTFLRTAFDLIVENFCTSLDNSMWSLVSESIGLAAAKDGTIAKQRICFLRAAIETDGTPVPVLISSLVAIANCCISHGHTQTANIYFVDMEGDEVSKSEKLLSVFERFFFTDDDALCMASLESACRILYYCGGCFPSVLSGCLLRCFSCKCPPRTYSFLRFFLRLYPSTSGVNQAKLMASTKRALDMILSANDNSPYIEVDALEMVSYAVNATKTCMLSANAAPLPYFLLPTHFYMIYFLIDWITRHPEDSLTAAVVDALLLSAPEELEIDKAALAALAKLTDEAIATLLLYECDVLVPKVRRFWMRLIHLEGRHNCSAASAHSKGSVTRHSRSMDTAIAVKRDEASSTTQLSLNTDNEHMISAAANAQEEGGSVQLQLNKVDLQPQWLNERKSSNTEEVTVSTGTSCLRRDSSPRSAINSLESRTSVKRRVSITSCGQHAKKFAR
uniref:Nuclear condensin complex subunit 3 C-terminal domain-containing protein n=1 Tax=Parascaris univalens TaxID=6257 RepID=A0A915A389_PARUN